MSGIRFAIASIACVAAVLLGHSPVWADSGWELKANRSDQLGPMMARENFDLSKVNISLKNLGDKPQAIIPPLSKSKGSANQRGQVSLMKTTKPDPFDLPKKNTEKRLEVEATMLKNDETPGR